MQHAIVEPFAGGLECHTACLAQGLASRGHSVTLFSAGGEIAGANLEMFCRETKDFAGLPDGGFAYEHHAYRDLMNTIASRRFDVIHNNALHYLPIAMADRLAVPMVTTLHTPPFWEMAGSIQLSPHANSFYAAVSPSVGRDWSSVMEVDFVVPNGVDLGKFRFQAIPATEAYLFWFGRIVPEKGLHLAIDAARFAGIRLLFAGPLADAGYFENEIKPRLGGDVCYLGHLKHDRLVALIGGASACLCTPMWEEPYGLVVAEVLACGTPVAGFARGALPDLVDSKSGLLVEPGNAQALGRAARAVQSLSRVDCRTRAAEIGDAEKMIRGYEALYVSLTDAAAFKASLVAGPLWAAGLSSRKLLRSHYLRNLPAEFSEVA